MHAAPALPGASPAHLLLIRLTEPRYRCAQAHAQALAAPTDSAPRRESAGASARLATPYAMRSRGRTTAQPHGPRTRGRVYHTIVVVQRCVGPTRHRRPGVDHNLVAPPRGPHRLAPLWLELVM